MATMTDPVESMRAFSESKSNLRKLRPLKKILNDLIKNSLNPLRALNDNLAGGGFDYQRVISLLYAFNLKSDSRRAEFIIAQKELYDASLKKIQFVVSFSKFIKMSGTVESLKAAQRNVVKEAGRLDQISKEFDAVTSMIGFGSKEVAKDITSGSVRGQMMAKLSEIRIEMGKKENDPYFQAADNVRPRSELEQRGFIKKGQRLTPRLQLDFEVTRLLLPEMEFIKKEFDIMLKDLTALASPIIALTEEVPKQVARIPVKLERETGRYVQSTDYATNINNMVSFQFSNLIAGLKVLLSSKKAFFADYSEDFRSSISSLTKAMSV